MPNELKPCPFCGGTVRIAMMGEYDRCLWWSITRGNGKDRCTCKLFMESEDFPKDAPMELQQEQRQKLIDRWNRRVDNACSKS